MFDSGMGGLTVLRACAEMHPNHQYFYVGDTAHLPYGEKSVEQLKQCVQPIIQFLIAQKIDVLIVACGTVSTILEDFIRQSISIPVIFVTNPTILYIRAMEYKKVGLLGTPGTIQSEYFQKQLAHYNIECVSLACPKFVPVIEQQFNDKRAWQLVVNETLGNFKTEGMDAIILGCTHYPLLIEQIINVLGENVDYINMGYPVSVMLDELQTIENESTRITLYFTQLNEEIASHISYILDDLDVSFEVYQLQAEVKNA